MTSTGLLFIRLLHTFCIFIIITWFCLLIPCMSLLMSFRFHRLLLSIWSFIWFIQWFFSTLQKPIEMWLLIDIMLKPPYFSVSSYILRFHKPLDHLWISGNLIKKFVLLVPHWLRCHELNEVNVNWYKQSIPISSFTKLLKPQYGG